MKKVHSVLCLLLLFVITESVFACTRVVYHGPNGLYLTARSMDFEMNIPTNLWIFPRGMVRDGAAGPSSLKWTSKYGSLIASGYDISTLDGMNEKGLVGNLLWLQETSYPEIKKDNAKKEIGLAIWLQYVLDNFATVDEAVKELSKEKFVVIGSKVPTTGEWVTLHLSISDAMGDNAIFEYIDGKLMIYHSRDYVVMTNSPTYSEQLAIRDYWEKIGGTNMLPGTNRAADRFVRASFYINAIPQTDDPKVAVPAVFSVIRNVSVPYGISTPEQPNISSTLWRVVADQKNLVYYFEHVMSPNIISVDLKKIDFSEKAPVKKLKLDNQESYAGECQAQFVTTPPFVFMTK